MRHDAVPIGTQTYFPATGHLRAHHSQTLGAGAVYGWHLDLEVEAKLGSGETRRAGYRCLFIVENRETPLFLAVVER